MVLIINKEEFTMQAAKYMNQIESGAIFIYGTDTIYGIGCNAADPEAVKRIRMIKERKEQPFSVIAPSKRWIIENCEINEKVKEWLEKLPGPYTLILKLKNKNAVCREVNPNDGNIGIRIPDHWFSQVVEALDFPVITTSVNRTDKMYMTSLDDLDHEIKARLDFILDEGKIEGFPSKVIRLDRGEVEIEDRSK